MPNAEARNRKAARSPKNGEPPKYGEPDVAMTVGLRKVIVDFVKCQIIDKYVNVKR
jgi:hypothetical protein